MINRINRIIEREKIKHPEEPALVLFFKRVIYVMQKKVSGLLMHLKKDSTFLSEDEMFMCSLLPQKAVDIVIAELKPSTVLDVGCGTGRTLAYFISKHIDGTGIENSETAISISPVKNRILRHNLNNELKLGRMFDLVWCFEVIEHIHPKFEKKFLQTLVNHAPVIVLSAARPGQGGHGHFNEQEPEYWIEKFEVFGFKLESKITEKLRATGETHAENLLCFKRRSV